jgi:hypothetical protein
MIRRNAAATACNLDFGLALTTALRQAGMKVQVREKLARVNPVFANQNIVSAEYF